MAGMPYPPNLCISVQSVGVFVGGYGIPAIPTLPSEFLPQNPFQVCLRKSSHGIHGIHGIHRNFWRRIFSHGFHRIHRIFWRRRASHRFHRCAQMVRLRRLLWEDSFVAALGMAGMPYPPNLCISVQSVGEYFAPETSVGSMGSVGRWFSGSVVGNLWVENKKMELNGIVVSIFFVSLQKIGCTSA